MSLLEVAGLRKAFGGVVAVDDLSFALDAGRMLAMIGPNGAGKSTCFAMLGGQLRPDRGSVRLDGRAVTGWPARRIWRAGVGRTFQVTRTFGSMSVFDNVQTVVLSHRRRLRSLLRSARGLYREEVEALLETVGIADQQARVCAVLAYGDLKRVELAMALAARPRLLLMDEPTAGMAPAERGALMRLIEGICRERALGVLFTEHDMDIVFEHADEIMVLARGRAIAHGTPAEVRADPQVQAVYLGEA